MNAFNWREGREAPKAKSYPQKDYYWRKKAGLTTIRNATRVNKHSEIGRTGEKSNSERAPR